MEFKDYYATLGVEPSAGDAEIKTAYRRLARKYHPDVSKEAGAEDKFKAINEAYEALRDPPKRAAYDQLRAQGYRPGEEFQAPPNYGGAQGYDFEEVFGNGGAGGGFSDFFESLFARQQRARQGGAGPGPGPGAGAGAGPAPRGDTRAKLAVPLEAVYSGDSVRITINGRQLDVRVPKGVRPGQVIRLSGQGNGGSNLLLEIEYAAHPQFEVDGLNILYTLPVTPWQAALGTSISVPTLGGAVELKIPPESDAGRKLRLRGRGLPGTPAGDQIVELEVLAPAPETEAQRKAYRGLAKAFGEAV
ncbi:DnaJ domain-containing protein [Xanthomonas translucens pv. translucens]|uniref:Chaperone protein n=3 Tax=Xanthomonas campestris pv. translucens TaxID=343 RepID=A0A1C3TRH5_XANCT|nr:DnaJ C-terminal domain-containing protein [Xanthomonas translucens]MCT8287177.1 DnaJ domain-containing protein [Xanthomonas translucens pv. translucens]MCT8304835.1 DnaJ domain-containing protein [Xanthomonas translucens pv. translucens]QSQ46610.1 DnaJ domain-containing protein [Xanthomonas translucens pv. translucens]UNU00844.1 DnaJ domain-containing protein [Xanthomonas translucens pv. translucens]SCB05796.1 chaperone protein [Xanthomonas translucens pv. translucens DSM 18974]